MGVVMFFNKLLFCIIMSRMEQPVEKTGFYWIGRVLIGVTVSCTGIIPACFTYCLSSLNYRPLKDNSILGLVSHKETEVIAK